MLSDILKNLGAFRFFSIIAVGLSILGFFTYIMIKANAPDMGLLFSQLDPADGGRILDRLKSMQMPVEVRGDGTQIFVPSSEIAKLRMELAQDGMPSGGVVGYEIFDRSDLLGTTTIMADLNHLRAIEGELSKSIRTIQGVQSARVHLVLPKKELFSKDKQETTASIMLRMKGTSILSANQVQAIQYLVSSAVPNLTLDRVSVIDDKGNLLARGNDSTGKGDSFTMQQNIRLEIENKMSRTIESLLDRTLGLGKSRSEVNIEMDFDQVTSTSVVYDPDGQVAKSTSTSEEGVDSNENQTVDAVSIQNALPNQNTNQSSGALTKNQSSNVQENINFEISNTTKNYVKETGTIKRLSIAVMVDGAYVKGKDGKLEYQPRDPKELEKLETLVKSAVGFKQDRGDTVSLVNLQFSESPIDEKLIQEKEPNFFLKDMNINKILEIVLSALVVLIGLFSIVKPIVSTVLGNGSRFGNVSAYGAGNIPLSATAVQNISNVANGQSLVDGDTKNQLKTDNITPDEEEPPKPRKYVKPKQSDVMINVDHIEGMVKDSAVKKVGELIDRHPEEAVGIIRSWLYAK
jgi:flagellar M-ring protein FliF